MGTEKAGSRGSRSARLVVAMLALIAVGMAPAVVSNTSLRDTVLQAIIGDSSLRVQSRDASFAWFAPLSIDDLRLESQDGSLSIVIGQLRAQRSWFSLWWSSPEIGAIEVDRPRVELVIVDQDGPATATKDITVKSFPTITVALRDASLLVRERDAADPVVDVSGIDVMVRTEQRTGGSLLIVDPIQLVQNQPLTAEMFNDGLQLVTPVLSDEISLAGAYSFELTKVQAAAATEAPAHKSDESKIEGLLTLHHVTGGLKNETTRRLAMFAVDLLELGEMPEEIRLTEEAKIAFRITEQRISHDGMAMFFPGIAPGFSVRTRGSVGLDEQLDLQATFQIPLNLLNDTPLASQLAELPLQLHVIGTIDQPRLVLPEDQPWVTLIQQRLASSDLSPEENDLAEQITKAFDELLGPTSVEASSASVETP